MKCRAGFRLEAAALAVMLPLLMVFSFTSCQKEDTFSDDILKKSVLRVAQEGEDVYVSRSYTATMDLQTVLAPCGPNGLLGIRELKYFNPEKSTGISHVSTSDWVGPYIVHASHDENKPDAFTGGWHAYNGDASGTPTARLVGCELYIDGQQKSGIYKEEECREVVVKATHLIQACNTKQADGNGREVLQENVAYRFRGDTLSITMQITALEDVVIDNYYGLQSCYGGEVCMFTQDSVYTCHTDGYNGAMSRVSKASCTLPDGRQVVCLLDSVGLGTQNRYNVCTVDTNRQFCFTSPFGKVYFRLVGEVGMPLQQGEQVFWSGAYIFRQSDERED